MKIIPLANSGETMVDDEDYENLSQWTWRRTSAGYAARNSWGPNGKYGKIYMHRFIMDAPKGMCVDHINRGGLDNRRCNLRICTYSENGRNRVASKSNKTGFKGVCQREGRYQAYIKLHGKAYTLGSYATPELALAARAEASLRLHGEFARIH
jgi:hypothetical protein